MKKFNLEQEQDKLIELKILLKNEVITYKEYLEFFQVTFFSNLERRKFTRLGA